MCGICYTKEHETGHAKAILDICKNNIGNKDYYFDYKPICIIYGSKKKNCTEDRNIIYFYTYREFKDIFKEETLKLKIKALEKYLGDNFDPNGPSGITLHPGMIAFNDDEVKLCAKAGSITESEVNTRALKRYRGSRDEDFVDNPDKFRIEAATVAKKYWDTLDEIRQILNKHNIVEKIVY